jgi:tetratricopeptide (TPR) repeat protein
LKAGRSANAVATALAAFIVVTTGPTLVGAVEPPADKAKQAQAYYQKAMTAYTLARFDQAIEGFTRAYELDPAPVLLFNLGQAHLKKGDNERARFFYRRYLEADPTGEHRARVEARLRELEALPPRPPLLAAAPPATAVAANPVPTTALTTAPPPPPLYRRPWFWGAVGALALVSVVTAVSLRSNDRPWSCGTGCPTHVVP